MSGPENGKAHGESAYHSKDQGGFRGSHLVVSGLLGFFHAEDGFVAVLEGPLGLFGGFKGDAIIEGADHVAALERLQFPPRMLDGNQCVGVFLVKCPLLAADVTYDFGVGIADAIANPVGLPDGPYAPSRQREPGDYHREKHDGQCSGPEFTVDFGGSSGDGGRCSFESLSPLLQPRPCPLQPFCQVIPNVRKPRFYQFFTRRYTLLEDFLYSLKLFLLGLPLLLGLFDGFLQQLGAFPHRGFDAVDGLALLLPGEGDQQEHFQKWVVGVGDSHPLERSRCCTGPIGAQCCQ